ncbi:MAG: T9SS type A sorting domain-containing protein [Saprospiraceae bacterium]|nr:T9SS type A sorting domain-containing protein [Saprospiraceae bacterium]
MRINGANITDLSPLAALSTVGGYLYFFSNGSLTNLDGLENLTAVGGLLEIGFNASLTNLDGLANLNSVGGRVAISNNASLTNLDGLANLNSVGGELSITSNTALTNIDGLAALNSVAYVFIGTNVSLTNLDGLANLTAVEDLYIESNDALTNIGGLDALTSVGGELSIFNNAALSACCDVYDLINGLNGKSVTGSISISGNATGCESVAVINTDADGDGMADCIDNCIESPNPDQADSDCDTLGDACDLCPGGDDSVDNNNDGLPDCKYPPAYAQIIAAWKCANNKVYICHNGNTLCINKNALAAHIGHGDYLGPCDNATCEGQGRGVESAQDRLQTATVTASVLLFPNPAFKEAWLDLSAFKGSAFSIRLFDMRRKILREFNVPEASEELMHLDLSGIAAGMYFVQLKPEGEEMQTIKLIIQK